jgi:hypothetical protein
MFDNLFRRQVWIPAWWMDSARYSMPERILRDLTDSDRYNAVEPAVRDLFIRIINKADDYGLLVADANRLRPLLYPLLIDRIRETDLARWISASETAGLVRFYVVDGRKYLQVNRWKQRMRNKKPKFPEPPWGLDKKTMSDICDADVGHPHGGCTADVRHPRTNAESETETDTPPPPGEPAATGETGGKEPPLAKFWADYPQTGRNRSSKRQVEEQWKKEKCADLQDAIFPALDAWKASDAWTRKGGEFVQGAHLWLKNRQWENIPAPARPPPDEDDMFCDRVNAQLRSEREGLEDGS